MAAYDRDWKEERELHSNRLTAAAQLDSVLGGYEPDQKSNAAAANANAVNQSYDDGTAAGASEAGLMSYAEEAAFLQTGERPPPRPAAVQPLPPPPLTSRSARSLPATSLMAFSKTLALDKPGVVGPNSYAISYSQTQRSAPRATMGTQQRFRASRYSYMSGKMNTDLLCTASPGPIYFVNPNNPSTRHAPAYSMGAPRTVSYGSKVSDRKSGASFMRTGSDAVGPAMYQPKHQSVLPAAPRAVFAQQPRFSDHQASITAPTGLGNPSGVDYRPNHELVHRRPPAYSFGHISNAVDPLTGRALATAPNGPLTDQSRTSFITHNIRGGLAKPATAEHKPIGPNEYHPDYDVGRARAPRHSFGLTARFGPANAMTAGGTNMAAYAGPPTKSNITPGPKYVIRDLTDKVETMRKKLSLTWMP